MLVLVKFRIQGNSRFLSHAETLRLFQRSCVRAAEKSGSDQNWSVEYSEGFNPRPKISLPLPRPVAVESDDEIACIQLNCLAADTQKAFSFDTKSFAAELSRQLPAGFKVLDITVVGPKTSVKALEAVYSLYLNLANISEKETSLQYLEQISSKIDRIMAEKSIVIKRAVNPEQPRFKNVDVRKFLKSIRFENPAPGRIRIDVRCFIRPEGTIRVNEILNLLNLSYNHLDAPVRRSYVEWQIGES
jgi:radical SAM-linked protein